jgi:hypothetical protein
VAGAVEWLGGTNPVKLIEERKEEDPHRGDERRVIGALAAWQNSLHDTNARPRTWWKAAEATTGIDADLWAAVIQFKAERPTNKQVGQWLTKRKDAVLGDLMLTGKPDRNGVMEWTLRGLRGSAGFVSNQPCKIGNDDKINEGVGTQPRRTPQTPHAVSGEPDDEVEL